MSRKESDKRILQQEALGVRELLKNNISKLQELKLQETIPCLSNIAQGIFTLQQYNEAKIIDQNPFVGINDTRLSFLQKTALTVLESHKKNLDDPSLPQLKRDRLNEERSNFTLITQAVENELSRREKKEQQDITLQETIIIPSIVKPKEPQPKLSKEQVEEERKIEEGRRGYLEKIPSVEELFGFDDKGNPRSWIQQNLERRKNIDSETKENKKPEA